MPGLDGSDLNPQSLPMPAVLTHRYDPAVGSCRNVCSLPFEQASRIIDQLRHGSRPTLKLDYLNRRIRTEEWLTGAAGKSLGRDLKHRRPVYFFLGDFSWFTDPSRPAALLIPLADVPPDAITFTLGDSMTVAQEADRRVYTLQEMTAIFIRVTPLAGFGFCDKDGPQKHFVEVQVWDHIPSFHAGHAPHCSN